MTRSLDADVTIAYVRELAQQWRRDESYYLMCKSGRNYLSAAKESRSKALVLEDLAQQLEQQAVKVA